MARKKDELKKARTCIHAIQLGELGAVWVEESCPNDGKVFIKKVSRYCLIGSRCNDCKAYRKKPRGKR